jgi:hypothetical protein
MIVLMRIRRSEAEWSAGTFSSETLEKASRCLRADGTLVVEDIVDPVLIREAREYFLERYVYYLDGHKHDDALQVGERRLMITLDVEGPFARRELIANPLLVSVLKTAFEDDFILGAYGVVCSLPGSPQQPIHQDGADLFRQAALNRLLPLVAVTVGIPLVEMSEINGTTALWPRSHRDDTLASTEKADEPLVREGSCVLWDYRLRHGGTPNRSTAPRPLLYMTYCRPWFLDHKNYQQQAAVRASKCILANAPEDLRRLLVRARD